MRKNYSHIRRIWKRNHTKNTYLLYLEARNQYFQEIKLAKQNHWNDFLENTDSEQIFKAYKYCKQSKIEKTPILQYNNSKLTTFSEKSKAFLASLFPNSANTAVNSDNFANNHTIYNNDSDNSWSELTTEELEKIILSCSSKKASGPDRIGFLIIQKAYSTIPELFHQLYYKLIKFGFHPDCWKDSIGVIIKKSNKDNYSDPKSYRIISLLNCLGKIAEKIIAQRLLFLAETTNLLYFDQIGGRKQKSAIDAAISLVSDIEINKHRKKSTSTLFLDVKGAFDHVNKSQLLKTCCNLKLSNACISWIHSFLSNRRIKLTFDGETMNSSAYITGIPQGSPVSPILFLIYISQLFKNNSKLAVRLISYIDDIAIVVSSKTIHENCYMLQNAAKTLIDWGKSHNILFNIKKTELIHFDSSNKSLNKSVKIINNRIYSQTVVK